MESYYINISQITSLKKVEETKADKLKYVKATSYLSKIIWRFWFDRSEYEGFIGSYNQFVTITNFKEDPFYKVLEVGKPDTIDSIRKVFLKKYCVLVISTSDGKIHKIPFEDMNSLNNEFTQIVQSKKGFINIKHYGRFKQNA